MTIFTAVSIALSTSGSAFAGLNHLSNLFEYRLKNRNEEAKAAYTFISENVPNSTSETLNEVRNHLQHVTFWFRVWKYCAFFPIVALVVFSSWVGGKVALRLDDPATEDLVAGEHRFYAVWIWVILGVSIFSLIIKLWSWWRLEANTNRLTKCKAHIEDSKPGNGESRNVRPG